MLWTAGLDQPAVAETIDIVWHSIRRGMSKLAPPTLECLLFGVPIEPEDASLLCVHFSAREQAPRGRTP